MSDEVQNLLTHAREARREGRVDVALQHYEDAANIYRANGDDLKLAHTIRHLGDIHREQAHPEAAAPYYDEALALYRSHPEAPRLDLANALRGAALLQDDFGRSKRARLLWAEAKELYESVGVPAGVEECSRRLTR